MSRWLERPSAWARRALGARPAQRLYIGDDAQGPTGIGPAGTGPAAPPDWHAALQPRFAALAPREALAVGVADAWCRFWITVPDPQADDLPALRAGAAARAQALYELNSADWVIEADWRIGQPFLCCALPQDLLAALRTLADAHRVPLRRVQPQAVLALQAADLTSPEPAAPLWLCSVSPRTVLSLVVEQRHLRHLRHSWWEQPHDDDAALAALLRDQATQLGLPEPAHVRRLGPAGHAERPGP